MVDLMNMKFFECYSCRRVLMFKADRNTGIAVYTVAVPAERRIYMEMDSGNGDSADP